MEAPIPFRGVTEERRCGRSVTVTLTYHVEHHYHGQDAYGICGRSLAAKGEMAVMVGGSVSFGRGGW